MTAVDNYESSIPPKWLGVFLELGASVGFDPTSSIEMEGWCNDLIKRCDPCDEATVKREVSSAFNCVTARPNWIQNPNWPVAKSGPMVFVGQVDCPTTAGLFHDETSFYVFFDPETGDRQTVMQVA
jgi:hypothetical protein